MPAFSEEQMKAIGGRMHMFRNQAKLTQSQFARILHISLSHYSKLEIGRGTIGPKLLQSFRRIHIPLDWLVDGKGPMPEAGALAEQLQVLATKSDDTPDARQETDLLAILDIALRPDILKLSEEICAKTGVSRNQALAMLVRQVLQCRKNGDGKTSGASAGPASAKGAANTREKRQ